MGWGVEFLGGFVVGVVAGLAAVVVGVLVLAGLAASGMAEHDRQGEEREEMDE